MVVYEHCMNGCYLIAHCILTLYHCIFTLFIFSLYECVLTSVSKFGSQLGPNGSNLVPNASHVGTTWIQVCPICPRIVQMLAQMSPHWIQKDPNIYIYIYRERETYIHIRIYVHTYVYIYIQRDLFLFSICFQMARKWGPWGPN
jgi:hypothetical protein